MKRREIRRSLQTSNLKHAKRSALQFRNDISRLFYWIEEMTDQKEKFSDEQKAQLKKQIEEFKTVTVDQLIAKAVAYEVVHRSIPSEIQMAKDALYCGYRHQINEQQRQDSLEKIRTEMIQLAEADAGVPAGYLKKNSESQFSSVDQCQDRFTDHFDKFYRQWKDNNPDSGKQRHNEYLGAIKRFSLIMGDDLRLKDLTKDVFKDFYDGMGDIPAGMKEGRPSKHDGQSSTLTLEQAKNAVLVDGKPCMSAKSRKKCMQKLGECTSDLHARGLLQRDPLAKFPYPKVIEGGSKAANEQRLAFTNNEVAQLLNSKELKGFKDGKDSHVFWMLMIMAYSGMRNGEALYLTHSALQQCSDSGLWCFNLDHERCPDTNVLLRRVKTNTSIRMVPVHSKLIEEGFVNHAMKRKGNGHYILHDMSDGWNSKNHTDLNQSSNRLVTKVLESVGIYEKKRKSAYSLRHTVCTQMSKQHGLSLMDIGAIVGHMDQSDLGFAGNSMTRRYIEGVGVQELNKYINLISYG